MVRFSNRVNKSEITAGDHVYTYRVPFIYAHHGVYVGDNKVVHFTRFETSPDSEVEMINPSPCPTYPDCGFRQPKFGECGVILSCLECFLQNGALYSYEYGVTPFGFFAKIRGGTHTTAQSDPPQIVVHRAMHLLRNGLANFDLFRNNCEDFALYCKTGFLTLDSHGIGRSGQGCALIGVQLAALFSSPLRLLIPNPIGLFAVFTGLFLISRYVTDSGVRRDVVKVAVEDMEALNFTWPSTDPDDLSKLWNLVAAILVHVKVLMAERRKFTRWSKKTKWRLMSYFSERNGVKIKSC